MTKKKKAILFSILGLILLLGIIFGVFSWISYMNREPFPIEMPETGYKYVRAEIGAGIENYDTTKDNLHTDAFGFTSVYVDINEEDYKPIIKALNKIKKIEATEKIKQSFLSDSMGAKMDLLTFRMEGEYTLSIITVNENIFKNGGQKAIYVAFTDENTGYDAEYKYYGPINDNSPLSSKSIYKMLEKYKTNK